MKKHLVVIIIILTLISISSGCFESDQDKIIGKWKAYEGYSRTQNDYLGYYIFYKNGNLSIGENINNISIFLTYEIENDKLIIYENNQSDILEYTFIEDDRFIINFIENGEEIFFTFYKTE